MNTTMDSAPGMPSALTTPPAFAATVTLGFTGAGSTVSRKVRGAGGALGRCLQPACSSCCCELC